MSEEEISKHEDILNKTLIEDAEMTDSLVREQDMNVDKTSTSTPTRLTENVIIPPPTTVGSLTNLETLVGPNTLRASFSNSTIFNKTTNPLEKYLNKFQVTDGVDVNLLLKV